MAGVCIRAWFDCTEKFLANQMPKGTRARERQLQGLYAKRLSRSGSHGSGKLEWLFLSRSEFDAKA